MSGPEENDSDADDGEVSEDHSSMDSSKIVFLTFEDVCEIHARGLQQFGFAMPGFLDEYAVRSAVAQPEAGAFGRYFHAFPAGMAAAYLFYLSNQQGFLNGNKRAAVGSAVEFLARNGYDLDVSPWELYLKTLELAGEDVKGNSWEKLTTLQEWIEDHLRPL